MIMECRHEWNQLQNKVPQSLSVSKIRLRMAPSVRLSICLYMLIFVHFLSLLFTVVLVNEGSFQVSFSLLLKLVIVPIPLV